ncbi:MAG: hypothetical protein LBV77_06960 [Candidatus Adiutrix intracellularis]|nr:hypothetical protein [Candidatus Adiutrix intracellularis]
MSSEKNLIGTYDQMRSADGPTPAHSKTDINYPGGALGLGRRRVFFIPLQSVVK